MKRKPTIRLKVKEKVKHFKSFNYDIYNFFDDADVRDTLEEVEFEDCCGAYIIYGFPEIDNLSIMYKRYTKCWDQEFKLWVQDVQYETKYTPRLKDVDHNNRRLSLAEFKAEMLSVVDLVPWWNQKKIGFIILNQNQLDFKPLILKAGYHLISDKNVNSNTHNRLYVFIRDPETPKGIALKKRTF